LALEAAAPTSNLVAAGKPVHENVGRVWARLSNRVSEPDASTVEAVERLVRKHFEGWFNTRYDRTKRFDEALVAAERAALEELERLLRSGTQVIP
jgi:hypothetical protein